MSTLSGWIFTWAGICFLMAEGSSTRSDFLSPEAFFTASSAAFNTASLSNEATVPYPHLPPIQTLMQTPPELFWTSCLSSPFIELTPTFLMVWDLASANSAPMSCILSTALYRTSWDCSALTSSCIIPP